MDTRQFFDKYVFGWMCADIEREISWAREGKSAGNVLTALGLLAYTEFMGSQLPKSRCPNGGARKQFEAFFRELGPDYAALLDNGVNIYDVFRCGLAHEYFVKGSCTIAMMNSTPGKLEVKGPLDEAASPPRRQESVWIQKPAECGIGVAKNGGYWFIVEKYYEDFKKACESLCTELLTMTPIPSPPIRYSSMSDSG